MHMYSDDEDLSDTDALLQEAFAKGELKPGIVQLNRTEDGEKISKAPEKQPPINKVEQLQAKIKEIKLPATFSWVERLDIVNDLAPLAPEIALQLDDHREKRTKDINILAKMKKSKKKATAGPSTVKSIEDDPIHNDFKREMTFYRQAQQAILKCLPRLKEMKIPTKRPDDYFAEMAKTDEHMQKVASVLQNKQMATERSEKVRQIRDQKKFAKQTQIQALQDKHKAKKEMLNSVKKYKEGQKNALDWLDDNRKEGAPKKERNKAPAQGDQSMSAVSPGSRDDKAARGSNRGNVRGRVNFRREGKNEKYGLGGKKKGAKYNTRDSVDDVDDNGNGGRGFPERRGRGNKERGGRGGSRGGRGGSRDGRGGSRDGRGGSRDGRGGSRDGRGGSRGGRGGSRGGRGGSRGGRGDSRGGRGFSGRGASRGGRGSSGDRGGRNRISHGRR